jgi:hypothetical protein
MITLNQNTRVSFEDITHSYLLDNEIYLMGVTSLMKKHSLAPNYEGIPDDVLQKAAERGSKVHKDIEDYCNGNTVAMTKELKAYISCGVKAIANEYLVSDNEIVASSIDIVADAGNGAVDLIDIKTTSTLHTDALSWQLSIYAFLFKLQNPDIKIAGLYGLHIKAGKANLVQVPKKPEDEIIDLLFCEREGLPFTPKTEKLSTPQKNALSELRGITDSIALIKLSLKEAEEKKKSVEKYILEQMELEGRKTLENGPIKVTYVAPYTKAGIDTKRLQEAMPEVYDRYKKITNIGASIKITIKQI